VPKPGQCTQTVFHRVGRMSFRQPFPCSRKAAVERDGRAFCKQHDPATKKAEPPIIPGGAAEHAEHLDVARKGGARALSITQKGHARNLLKVAMAAALATHEQFGDYGVLRGKLFVEARLLDVMAEIYE
jgi:hypothetical protein